MKKLTFPINNISEHQLIFFDLGDSEFILFRKEEREKSGKKTVRFLIIAGI